MIQILSLKHWGKGGSRHMLKTVLNDCKNYVTDDCKMSKLW